jgi:hypothetical protein
MVLRISSEAKKQTYVIFFGPEPYEYNLYYVFSYQTFFGLNVFRILHIIP